MGNGPGLLSSSSGDVCLSPTGEETDPIGRKWKSSFHEDLGERSRFVDQE